MSDADVPPSSSLDPIGIQTPGVPHKDNVASKAPQSPHRSDQKLPPPPNRADADRDEDTAKADSEAETIIQSGRESLSPEKRRKHTQHAAHVDADKRRNGDVLSDGELSLNSRKRKLSHAMSCINGQELGLSPKLTVVGNDFVCQSLILGRLFEA